MLMHFSKSCVPALPCAASELTHRNASVPQNVCKCRGACTSGTLAVLAGEASDVLRLLQASGVLEQFQVWRLAVLVGGDLRWLEAPSGPKAF